MGGPNTLHGSEYGSPGHRKADPIASITQGAFNKQCDAIRELQGTSTEKVEWVINDSTTFSYELHTYNGETAPTMDFVLRRDDVVIQPENRSDVQKMHRWLQKEGLHTTIETLLDETLNPPAP